MGMGSGIGGAGKGGGMMSNPSQTNQYNTDYARYTSQFPNQQDGNISGSAFNDGGNNGTGIASIIAGLMNSGAFNQSPSNPYAPQGTLVPQSIPYGQQQESMFNREDFGGYGGQQGQSWNPYGNYYTVGNTSAGGGNTTNTIAPPPRTTGPDALQQLSYMMRNNQNTQI
jgi:hypothetical protein